MRLKSTKENLNYFTSKDDFRKKSKKKIEKVTNYKVKYNSKIVLKKINDILKGYNFKNALLYIPLKNEVDISPLVSKLRKTKNIYVPFMECASFKLVKYRLPVKKKKFNIFEPPNSWYNPQKIDVAVVPVIGVDGMMRRVGFGKGMYDRFFESLSPKPLVIFVQLTKCFTTQKLCEPFDIQADIYITPTDTIIKRGKDDFRGWNRNSNSCHNRSSWIFNSKKTRCSKS